MSDAPNTAPLFLRDQHMMRHTVTRQAVDLMKILKLTISGCPRRKSALQRRSESKLARIVQGPRVLRRAASVTTRACW